MENPWMEYMRKGAFEEAWKYSDQVIKSGANRDYLHLPRHFQCIWDGTPLAGKRVLIRCYHGLGDTIQFIRYAPLVKRIARKVILWAPNRLIELLKTAKGIDEILPLHDGSPEVDYDVDVEIMELPHVFRTTLQEIPLEMPYLYVDKLPLRAGEGLNIGLVWQAGNWDQSRSVPFHLFRPLSKIKKCHLYILQDNPIQAGWEPGVGIYPMDCNLFEHARIIRWLDLLITVDSMPAHLAGALNVPVWVILNHRCDWRWMENRTDSPWYPSMKLFRQKSIDNWEEVVEEIISKLETLALR